jgi:hypothetical protein
VTTHPMLREKRPLIATRPIEELADSIKVAIEDGHHGLQVRGRAQDGKSTASEFLISHSSWIENFVLMRKISMERRTNLSDTSFYMQIQKKLGLTQHWQSNATQRVSQITSLIIAECISHQCMGAVMFIDESQWMNVDDFEYLTNIDNSLADDGYRLFCVFINQTDDTKAFEGHKKNCRKKELPPHVVGRFFMDQHTFTGLRGTSDIAHALDQYDRQLIFDGKAFSEYFAPRAYSNGWRFASHSNDFLNAIAAIRERNGLPGNGDLPMKVFELAAYRLLARKAPEIPNFSGFNKDMIDSVMAAPYMQLERARMRQAVT